MMHIKIGGGICCKKLDGIPLSKCAGSFKGGSNGGNGQPGIKPARASGPSGSGTGVRLDQFSMQYFHLSPGDGGTQDEGVELNSKQVFGGGGGGVLVNGVGPKRESTCQGEGYGGGAGALLSHSIFKMNNFVGAVGLPGVILIEVY